MGAVVSPLAFVDVSVRVDEAALAVGHAAFPVAFVDGAVAPDLVSGEYLLAFAVLEVALPLADVDGACVEFVGAEGGEVLALFEHLGVGVVLEGAELLEDGLGVGVVDFGDFLGEESAP